MRRLQPSRYAPSALLLCLLGAPALVRADEGPGPPPIPRTEGLDDYRRLAIAEVPAFDTSILALHDGTDWMNGKSIHDIAQAVQDVDPTERAVQGPVTVAYDLPDGLRFIKMDTDRGYIRYSNRDRSFHEGIPCGAITPTLAQALFGRVVTSLGLPTNELGSISLDTAMEKSVDGEGDTPPETNCEIERLLTLKRQAPNGLPVFDGWARCSISNLSQPARLAVRWPRLRLAHGLTLRSRAEVIGDLTQRIWGAEADQTGLGPQITLRCDLGYIRTPEGFIPVVRASFSDIYDAEAGQIEAVPLAFNPASSVPPEQVAESVQLRAFYDARGRNAVMEFYLPNSRPVRLSVMDAAGRVIALVADGVYGAGWHRVDWDLRDAHGRSVPSGMYFTKLQAGTAAPAQKIIVVH
jgi:hypothetical protein